LNISIYLNTDCITTSIVIDFHIELDRCIKKWQIYIQNIADQK